MTLIEMTRQHTAWIMLLSALLVSVIILMLSFFVYRETRLQEERIKVQLLREIREDLKEIQDECL